MPYPGLEALVGKGRNVAGATDPRTSRLTAEEEPPKNRLLSALSNATSGRSFLKSVSGGRLDISGLPGYLEEPVDILVNPLSLGLIAAAPFTGGGSLAALSAKTAGQKAGGVAIKSLAGGLVGGAAAKETAKHLPEDTPGVIKALAPLVAGVAAGGITEVKVGSRLSSALDAGARAGKQSAFPTKARTSATTNYDMYDAAPLDLPIALPGKTKTDQIADTFKVLVNRGIITNQQAKPLLDQGRRTAQATQDIKTVVHSEVLADISNPVNQIKYMADPTTGKKATHIFVKGTKEVIEPTRADMEIWLAQRGSALDSAKNQRLASQAEFSARAGTFHDILLNRLEDASQEISASIAKGARTGGYSADDEIAFLEKARQLAQAYAPKEGLSKSFLEDAETRIDDMLRRVEKAGNEEYTIRVAEEAKRLRRVFAKLKEEADPTPPKFDVTPNIPDRPAPRANESPEGWFPLNDVMDNPSLYPGLTAEQLSFMRKWDESLRPWWDLYGATRKKFDAQGNPIPTPPIGSARTMAADGFFGPRGRPVEDGTHEIIAQGRPKNLNATPGQARERVYNTVAEGLANGEEYPPFEQAVADYVEGIGNAINGRDILNNMMKLTDPTTGEKLILDLNRTMPLRDEFDNIIMGADGNAVKQNYMLDVPRDYALIAGQQGKAAPKEIARQLNNMLDPQHPTAMAGKLAEAFNRPLRSAHVALDLGDFIARIGPTAAVMHPGVFAKGVKTGFASVFNSSLLGKEFNMINEENIANGLGGIRVQDFAKWGLRMQNTDFAPGALKNLPVIGKMGLFYGNALDLIRARMMQAELLKHVKKGVPVSDDLLKRVSTGINITTGAAAGLPVKDASILIQFPNWLQSQVEFLTTAAANGQIEGQYARQALLRLVALGTTAGIVGSFATGNLKSKEDLKDVVGLKKDADIRDLTVPSFRVGDRRIDIFGPYSSLFRGVKGAIAGDPTALIRGRSSPLVQLGWDLVTGQTFSGEDADFLDTAYWAKIMQPYSLASLTRDPGVGGALSAIGVNAREDTPYSKVQREAEATFGKSYADFTGKERQQLKQARPDLFADLDARTRQRAEAGDRKAQGVVATQEATDSLLSAQETAYEQFRAGEIDAKQLRETINNLSKATAERKQQIRLDYGLDTGESKPPTPVQEALDKFYGLYNSADIGVLAGGEKIGQLNWEEFERQQAELMASFTPEQLKAIDDRVTTHAPALNWYYENRDYINSTGYFRIVDTAFARYKPLVNKFVKDADSMSDLYRAQNLAIAQGNRGQYVYVSTLINKITALAENYKKVERIKNPTLQTALIQNGYLSQPRTGLVPIDNN